MREIIKLICTGPGGESKSSCAGNNMYASTKNKKASTKKIELRKYCKHCNKHTIHKEGK